MNNCHIKHILLISFTFLIYYTLNSISVTFYFHNHFTPKILSSALLLGFRMMMVMAFAWEDEVEVVVMEMI